MLYTFALVNFFIEVRSSISKDSPPIIIVSRFFKVFPVLLHSTNIFICEGVHCIILILNLLINLFISLKFFWVISSAIITRKPLVSATIVSKKKISNEMVAIFKIALPALKLIFSVTPSIKLHTDLCPIIIPLGLPEDPDVYII